jgi:hypothetical protein
MTCLSDSQNKTPEPAKSDLCTLGRLVTETFFAIYANELAYAGRAFQFPGQSLFLRTGLWKTRAWMRTRTMTPSTRWYTMLLHRFKKQNPGPWRRGIVVIASALRTEDPGFESRQGVRFLGGYT